jgi:hypothetical protein
MDKKIIKLKLATFDDFVDKLKKIKGFILVDEENNYVTLIHEIQVSSNTIPFYMRLNCLFTITSDGYESMIEVYYSEKRVYKSLLNIIKSYSDYNNISYEIKGKDLNFYNSIIEKGKQPYKIWSPK